VRAQETIREAEPADLDGIMKMGERFVAETTYSKFITVDPAWASKTVIDIVSNDDGAVFVVERDGKIRGMIAAQVYPHPYSGVRTATEAFWWVDPEARGCGLRLLSAMEAWAKGRGAKVIQMTAPTESIGRLYESLGYESVETSYQRSV